MCVHVLLNHRLQLQANCLAESLDNSSPSLPPARLPHSHTKRTRTHRQTCSVCSPQRRVWQKVRIDSPSGGLCVCVCVKEKVIVIKRKKEDRRPHCLHTGRRFVDVVLGRLVILMFALPVVRPSLSRVRRFGSSFFQISCKLLSNMQQKLQLQKPLPLLPFKFGHILNLFGALFSQSLK